MVQITFVISRRETPKKLAIFYTKSRWVKCRIKILKSANPRLVNTYAYFRGVLPSCATYFTYSMHAKFIKGNTVLEPLSKNTKITCEQIKRHEFTDDDKDFMMEEVNYFNDKIDVKELRKEIKDYKREYQFPKTCVVHNYCAYFRFGFEAQIKHFFKTQDEAISLLSIDELKKCIGYIKKTPWMLMFYTTTSKFKLKELSLTECCEAIDMYKLKPNPLVKTAMRIYTFIRKIRDTQGCTMFSKEQITKDYKISNNGKHNPQDIDNIEKALNFLNFKAIRFDEGENDYFACIENFVVASEIKEILDTICFNAVENDPILVTSTHKRCKTRGELTDEQQQASDHVDDNWITMVLGGPGHGKSEVIVDIVSKYKNILVVTYVGKAVDVVFKRTNNYENVHTIHYVYFKTLYAIGGEAWIQKFDVVVVDEMSNVDSELFLNFLRAIRGVCRLVLVGDMAQINPIGAGCPFEDLIGTYESDVFYLTKNMRVDGNSKVLADMAKHIKNNEIDKIDFNGRFLKRVDRTTMEDVLHKVLTSRGFDIMNFQCIGLRNIDVDRMNIIIENWLDKYIKPIPQDAYRLRGKFKLYPGKKIMFTKNTKPDPDNIYDSVRNGEICEVMDVKRVSYGAELRTICGKKILICDKKGFVSRDQIKAGYAITANKSQASEWPHVLFWIHEDLIHEYYKTCIFTREYFYVAESRAKETCTVVGSIYNIKTLCENKAIKRVTILKQFLF